MHYISALTDIQYSSAVKLVARVQYEPKQHQSRESLHDLVQSKNTLSSPISASLSCLSSTMREAVSLSLFL